MQLKVHNLVGDALVDGDGVVLDAQVHRVGDGCQRDDAYEGEQRDDGADDGDNVAAATLGDLAQLAIVYHVYHHDGAIVGAAGGQRRID